MTVGATTSASQSRRLLHNLADVAPVLAGVLLLIAAGSKTYTLFGHGSPSHSYWPVEVALEWAAAATLLSGRWSTATRRLGIVCFVIFAAIAIYEMWLNRTSCGCFGEIPVKPLETLILDLIVLTLLVLSEAYKGGDHNPRQPPRTRQISAAAMGVVGVGLACLSLSHRPASTPLTLPITSFSAAEKSHPVLEINAAPLTKDPAAFVVDLGYVPPSSERPFGIILPPIVLHDIRIKRTIVECGCTEIVNPPHLFQADVKTKLNLLFHAPDQIGPYSKKIVFELHNLNPKSITMCVTSRIGLPLSVEAISAPQSQASIQKGQSRFLKIRNDGPSAIHLLYSTSDVPGCYAVLTHQPLLSSTDITIPIFIPDHSPLMQLIHIQIHTDCFEQPELDSTVK